VKIPKFAVRQSRDTIPKWPENFSSREGLHLVLTQEASKANRAARKASHSGKDSRTHVFNHVDKIVLVKLLEFLTSSQCAPQIVVCVSDRRSHIYHVLEWV